MVSTLNSAFTSGRGAQNASSEKNANVRNLLTNNYYMEVWQCGSVEVWQCGSLVVWKSGSLEVWKCGSLAVWVRAGAHMERATSIHRL